MNYCYLLINLALLLIALAVSLDKKAKPFRSWKLMVPAVLISGLFFSVPAFFFSRFVIWSFNPDYIIGVYIGQLPIEEMLFYFILSFTGLNIYVSLNERFAGNDLEKFSLSVSNLLLGLCIAMLFFTYARWYSAVTFSILFLLLFYVEYINKLRFMYRFYRTYIVSLIPFYLSFAAITGLPVLNYSNTEITKLRLGTIPFENHFYFMGILLLNVYLFELLKNKTKF